MPPSSLPAAVRYDLWRVEIAVHAAGLDVTRDKELGFAPRPTVGGCIARPTLNGHLVARQKFLPSNRSFRCVFVVEWDRPIAAPPPSSGPVSPRGNWLTPLARPILDKGKFS